MRRRIFFVSFLNFEMISVDFMKKCNRDYKYYKVNSGDRLNFKMEYTLEKGKIYYVKAKHYSSKGTGKYNIVFREKIIVVKKLVENSTKYSQISTTGEEDWYSFIPSKTATYTINSTGSTDTYGRLYSKLDSGYMRGDNNGGQGNNFKIEYNLSKGRTYYIKVSHSSSYGTGSYGLIAKEKVPVTTITVGRETSRKTTRGGEWWYKFRVNETGSYVIETQGNANTTGYLYNQIGGSQLTSSSSGGKGSNFKIEYELEKNKDYYVKIGQMNTSSSRYYTFYVAKLDITYKINYEGKDIYLKNLDTGKDVRATVVDEGKITNGKGYKYGDSGWETMTSYTEIPTNGNSYIYASEGYGEKGIFVKKETKEIDTVKLLEEYCKLFFQESEVNQSALFAKDLYYIQKGILHSLDDNVLFGILQWVQNDEEDIYGNKYTDDYYYSLAKNTTDAICLAMYYTTAPSTLIKIGVTTASFIATLGSVSAGTGAVASISGVSVAAQGALVAAGVAVITVGVVTLYAVNMDANYKASSKNMNQFKEPVSSKIKSRIGENSQLKREAEKMGKDQRVQAEANQLINKLLKGNTNPGRGSKNLFKDISYLRSKNGARVFYRVKNGVIEVLAKASKKNESIVIEILNKLYG